MCWGAWQVLLLLKSSDRVLHDVCSAFESCAAPPTERHPLQLALRRHYDLRPEGELRCFVHDHRLVGALWPHLSKHLSCKTCCSCCEAR